MNESVQERIQTKQSHTYSKTYRITKICISNPSGFKDIELKFLIKLYFLHDALVFDCKNPHQDFFIGEYQRFRGHL